MTLALAKSIAANPHKQPYDCLDSAWYKLMEHRANVPVTQSSPVDSYLGRIEGEYLRRKRHANG